MNNPNPNIPNPPNPNHQNHACAACRYQRRKCNRDCPLAPYFPPDSQTKFLNAHKLFGVGNILKMIRSLPDLKDRDIAMQTMMIQSDLRAKDPVLGSVGLIMNLRSQISTYQNDLNHILHLLASFRAHHHQSAFIINPNTNNHNYVDVDVAAAHDYLNQPPQNQLQLLQQEGGGGEGYEGILDHQESGGGGENGNFQEDLNNGNHGQQWRLMNENVNETGLIENGNGNGMSNMMMMMMMKEEEEVQAGEDALVPVLEERQFFHGFDRTNETNMGSSSENIPKVEEPDDSIVQNEEQTIRKECSNSSINEEETRRTTTL